MNVFFQDCIQEIVFFSKFFGIIAWNLSTKGRKIFRGNFIRNPWLICFGRFLDEFLIELFEISPAGIVEAMSEINRELFFEKINTKIVGSIIWKTSEDILVNFQDKSLSQIKTTGINVQWFFFSYKFSRHFWKISYNNIITTGQISEKSLVYLYTGIVFAGTFTVIPVEITGGSSVEVQNIFFNEFEKQIL